MTASAPSRTARADGAGHAAVLERAGRVRALELQPDLGADALGECGAGTSGVEPSPSVTTGSSARERQAVAVALDQARAHAVTTNCSSITRIARGGERRKSSARDLLDGGEEARLEHRVDDHHEPRVLAQALLHDRLDRGALLAEHAGRPARARPGGRRPRGAGRTTDSTSSTISSACVVSRRRGGRDHRADRRRRAPRSRSAGRRRRGPTA